MSMDTDKLMDYAATYKKGWEHYSLNPFAYVINNRKYYLVFYHSSRPDDVKGHAVISLDDGPQAEYKAALLPLTIMVGSGNQIFNIVGPRSEIDPNFFTDTIEVVEAFIGEEGAGNGPLIDGLHLYRKLHALHTEFIELYNTYLDDYDNGILARNVVTDEDIDYTNEVLAKFSILQFQQGIYTYQNFEKLVQFQKSIRHHKLHKKIPKQSWKFIKGMVSAKKNLTMTLGALQFERSIAHLAEEEQVKAIKKELYRINEKMLLDRKRNLRGPAVQ